MNITASICETLDINKGEGPLVGLMVVYNFMLLITLYLLKPVRDSLFLVELGPQQLPFVFILTALVVIPISMGYSRLSNRMALSWVINGVTVLLAASLVVIWWMLQLQMRGLYYVLYIWVSIYSILITSQFWLLANALFNATQAKRIFSLLSLAAIAGAIAGGEITGLLVKVLGVQPQTLVWIAAAALLATLVPVMLIRRLSTAHAITTGDDDIAAEKNDDVHESPLFKDILQSKHLMLIVGIIAISVITTTLIDYQFKTLASRVYTTDNALTSFMGHFYGRVSIVALLFQFFVSSRFLDRSGVGGAIALLPSILLLGTAGLFVWPVLAAGVFVRGADQSLKHSLDRTGRELLFVPVEMDLKKRTKVFIDLFVDNGAQGLAGLLLLFFTFIFTLTVQQLAIVVALLLAIWIVLAVWVRRSYVNQFRESIEEQVQESPESDKERSPQELIAELRRASTDRIPSLLKQLEDTAAPDDLEPVALEQYLNHPSATVRRQAIHLFRTHRYAGYAGTIAPFLEDANADVRLEAARYLYHFYEAGNEEGARLDLLRQGLQHKDHRIKAVAMGLIAKEGGPAERALVSTGSLKEAIQQSGHNTKDVKIEVARLLGAAYSTERKPLLRELLQADEAEVVQQAILSAGESGDREFVPTLLDYLDSEPHKEHAQQALALFGTRIFGTLFDYLTDEIVPLSKRLSIPPVLQMNANAVALEVLQMALDEATIPVRHAVIKAINKMLVSIEGHTLSEPKLRQQVIGEIKMYAQLSQSRTLLDDSAPPSVLKLVDKEIMHSFEDIFRLLGLLYNSEDIYNAYKSIRSDKPKLVSEGIEFLENLIDWEEKKYLLPLFESITANEDRYGEFSNLITSPSEAQLFLRQLNHPELRKVLSEQTHHTVTTETNTRDDG